MTKADQRAESAALLRQARYGKRRVRITKLPPGARQYDSITEKRGGTLPGHLDARTLPDDPEDMAQRIAILQEHCL